MLTYLISSFLCMYTALKVPLPREFAFCIYALHYLTQCQVFNLLFSVYQSICSVITLCMYSASLSAFSCIVMYARCYTNKAHHHHHPHHYYHYHYDDDGVHLQSRPCRARGSGCLSSRPRGAAGCRRRRGHRWRRGGAAGLGSSSTCPTPTWRAPGPVARRERRTLREVSRGILHHLFHSLVHDFEVAV